MSHLASHAKRRLTPVVVAPRQQRTRCSTESAFPELAGKRVVLTGASGRFGHALAVALAEEGCRIVLQLSEHAAEVDGLIEAVELRAPELRVFRCDPDDQAAVERLAAAAVPAFEGCDILIGCVDSPDLAQAARDTEQAVADAFRIPVVLSEQAAEAMRDGRRGGTVIYVGPPEPHPSPRGLALHRIALATLEGLVRAQAETWAADGIRVNGLCIEGPQDPAAHPGVTARQAARTVLELASGRARNLGGLTLKLDCAIG